MCHEMARMSTRGLSSSTCHSFYHKNAKTACSLLYVRFTSGVKTRHETHAPDMMLLHDEPITVPWLPHPLHIVNLAAYTVGNKTSRDHRHPRTAAITSSQQLLYVQKMQRSRISTSFNKCASDAQGQIVPQRLRDADDLRPPTTSRQQPGEGQAALISDIIIVHCALRRYEPVSRANTQLHPVPMKGILI